MMQFIELTLLNDKAIALYRKTIKAGEEVESVCQETVISKNPLKIMFSNLPYGREFMIYKGIKNYLKTNKMEEGKDFILTNA